MSSPAISVLLPTRDNGPLLRTAVDSILQQTLTDLELIVVDDGSCDGSLDGLPGDPRLRILASPARGIVAALNAAAAAARAPLLARMDGDDIALPQRLQQQCALLQAQPSVGIVGAQVEIFTQAGAPAAGYRRYQAWLNALTEPQRLRREIFVESPLPHPSVVMRRCVFERLGGYRDCPWAEDYDLWLRAFSAGIRMAKPHGVLLRWRDHPERASRVDPRYSLAAFTRAKAYYLSRTVLGNRPAVIWGAAPTGAQLHDALTDQGVAVLAFLDIDPRKIGGRKRGKPVLPWQAADRFGDALVLGAVGRCGARARMRNALQNLRRTEGEDFWFTA